MTRWTIRRTVAAALAVPVVLVTVATGTAHATDPARTSSAADVTSHLATVFIPDEYLRLYRDWNTQCPEVSWSVVAAVGDVGTSHGRLGKGAHAGTNPDGTAGPMRLGVGGEAGDVWADFGLDGDGDGTAEVHNPADAIRGAYNYLCDLGAGQPDQLREALYAYTGSSEDVDSILREAERYRQTLAPDPNRHTVALLDNPKVKLALHARWDLADGHIDPRVSQLLNELSERYTITVDVLRAAHPEFITGTRTRSGHYAGRAVDISHVNGQRVSAGNTAAHDLVASLSTLEASLGPDEIGSPFPEFNHTDGPAHDDHRQRIHLGFHAA